MKYTAHIFALFATTANAWVAPVSKTASSTQLNGMSPGVVSKTGGWEIDKISPKVRIEGQSRHTFSMQDPSKEVVQVSMHSPNGRPITSDVDLWIGPDWTPVKVGCHTEDGSRYPLQTLVGTRNMNANVELLNTGNHAYPIDAACSYAIQPLTEERETIKSTEGTYLEGGAIKMQPIPANVDQLQVLITTEGKMLNAMIELLNGPNNVKVEYEVFTNNGELNSLFVVFECPEDGNAIRIRNLAPLEFPCKFYVNPTKFSSADSEPTWNA